jgi:anti-anti-sigma factor
MKRHLALSTASQPVPGNAAEVVVDRARAGNGESGPARDARVRPRVTLASVPVWRHKLILTGKLDYRSAPELEEEIECLCEEGVTTLMLDLRRLDAIDSTGVTTIVCRGATCKRSGHDFAVIAGSQVIRSALAEAGATDLLTPDPNEALVRRFAIRASDGSTSDRSTEMVKSL